MTKSATDVAASARDDSMVTADVLLRSQTFQQRLDQARAARERALQAGGKDEASPATLSKPWERAAAAHERHAAAGTAPFERAAPTLFFPEGVRPAPPANRPAPAVAPEAVADAAPPRSTLTRTVIGFSLGLGLGLALALWLRPATTPDQAVTLEPGEPSPPAGADAALAGAILTNGTGADATAIIPASAEGTTQRSAAAAPAGAAPETPPARPAAQPEAAPAIWIPATADALPVTPGEAMAAAPASDATPRMAGLAMALPVVAMAEDAPRYGMEPRAQVPGLSPDRARLTIKVLSPAAPDTAGMRALSEQLVGRGFPPPDVGQVGFAVRHSQVRYYHAADAEAAAALAAEIGAEARDFTGTDPAPPDGLIELWIAPPEDLDQQTASADKAPKAPAAKAPAKKKTSAAKARKAAQAQASAAQASTQAADAAEAARVKARLLLLLQGAGNP